MGNARTLVLGATGRIGGLLRREQGAGPPMRWQTRSAPPAPGWVRADPLDAASVARAAEGCGTILCLAGVTPARAARGGDLGANAALALAAGHAAAAVGARVLLVSSASVYGNRSGLLDEATPLAPVSPYGIAKQAMEARARNIAAVRGVALCSLRIGNVAGADATLGGWQPGFALDRFPNGCTPRRSYIGPVTLARVLRALSGAQNLPAVLNIAAPGSVEMGALLDQAGLGWQPRPAPQDAIARVELATARLARLVDLPPAAGQAATLVAEWQGGAP
ncbi:NAD-dependent epimerase/dehydratase family protein [Pontibaca salina]|uniref:NAD-dependent epimerase/dehydratase family protein n=1 Tax=Pontibaca salina TaxID=2795731 RepID=UPI002FCD78C8